MSNTATGGQLLVGTLEELGVRIAFGLPGVHNLPAWAAFASSRIRLVGVRHEQTSAYAADGQARVTGELGVAITTTGPGAANALGATGEAWASHSPVLVVATDIPTTLRRPGVYRGVLHETTDQAAMFAPITKGQLVARSVEEIPGLVRRAAALAQTAPSGPVYLEVPTDLLSGAGVASDDGPVVRATTPAPRPDALQTAKVILDAAERPLIWAGGGAARAGGRASVELLAERLAAPVIETYGARGLVRREHPGWIGLPPHVPEVGRLWDEADVVLAIGSDFDGMTTQNWLMPQPPKLVAINVSASDATKNYRADVIVEGDADAATAMLAALVEPRIDASWHDPTKIRAEVMQTLRADHPDAIQFLDALREVLPDRAIVAADMCIPGYWVAAFHPFPEPRRLIYPVGWGTLGCGFPASLGAAIAQDDPVLCVTGDGGFLFACGELALVAQERIPVTILLIDDGGYGMLRYDQRHVGERPFGVDLHTPNWVALARSFGIEAERVDNMGPELAAALERGLRRPGPSLIALRAELDPPPTTSPRWYRRAQGAAAG